VTTTQVKRDFPAVQLDSGINLNTVRQIAGHMDEKTTLNNYCYGRSDEQEKLDQMARALS